MTLRWIVGLGLVSLATAACTSTPPMMNAGDSGGMDAMVADVVIDVAVSDQGTCVDMDNDGHPSAACGGDDCDDNNPRRSPSAREVCDSMGVDEDCNPCTVGEVLPGGVGGDGDRDEDGFPSRACFNRVTGARPMCTPLVVDGGADGGAFERLTVSDTEVRGTDCDDGTRTRNPAVSERCDERLVDENCAGGANEGCSCPTPSDPAVSRRCVGVVGECARGTQDCVDGEWSMCSIAPAMTEVCDGRDDDCDGMIDEGLRRSCFRDVDGDGLAAAGTAATEECGAVTGGMLACPAGFTELAPSGANVDCDDSVATGFRRSPRLAEVPCNGVDDDCNSGTSDAACPIMGATCATGCACPVGQILCGGRCLTPPAPTCTVGVGVCQRTGPYSCASTGALACSVRAGAPGTVDVPCNSLDDNCNGATDEMACSTNSGCNGTMMCTCNSGFAMCGSACAPTGSCTTTCGSTGTWQCAAGGNTCMRPAETCNGRDDDCDGLTDEGFECSRGTTRYCQRCLTGGPRVPVPVAGTNTCTASCVYDGRCLNGIVSDRDCNGLDDDCNGSVDDGNLACLVPVNRGYAAGPTRVYTRTPGSALPMFGLSDDRRQFRVYPSRTGAAQTPVFRCSFGGRRIEHVCFGGCSPGAFVESLGFSFADVPSSTNGLTGMIPIVHLQNGSDELYTADPTEISTLEGQGWRRTVHPCTSSPFAGSTVAGYAFGPTRP